MIRTGFAAALGFATGLGMSIAFAADMSWPYTKAPVMGEAIYSWAGLYVGGHVGASQTSENWTNTANTTLFGDLSPHNGFSQQTTGVFGGGQLGYNWQAGNYVFGMEGTASAMNNRGGLLNTVFGVAKDDVFSWKSNAMATVTARLGYAVNNNLFYAKGGYAGISSHLAVVDAVPPFVGSGSDNHWHNGWTVGAGWEYGLTRNWIVGLEYDYAAFTVRSYELDGTSFGAYTFDAKPGSVQSVVARASYKFNAPVPTRY